jgi:hypothetical protein
MKKFVVKLAKIKKQFVRKVQVYGAGSFRIWTQRVRKCYLLLWKSFSIGTFRGHSKRPSTVVQKPSLIVRAKHENEILYNATILKTERRFNKYTIFRFTFNY